jgi:hypothetical protein
VLRPKLYHKNEAERRAWIELIEQARKTGILNFVKSDIQNSTVTETADGLEYEINATTINTKEKLIQACKIDTNQWEIISFRVSTWQQKEDGKQLFSVRCKFKQKTDVSADDILKAIETGLKAQIRPKIAKRIENTGDYVAMINIFDAHIDKVTRYTETGEQAEIVDKVCQFTAAFDYLLDRAENPKEIIFPVGNDFFNVNDSRSTTKKGTPQDSSINFIDAFSIGLNLILECIDKAAEVSDVVHIPIIAGNHAEDLEYLLGSVIETIYRNNPKVRVYADRRYRKYLSFGHNLFMLAHGDRVKNKIREIPNIMATEEPELWADHKFRYAIFGDIHHEQTHDLRGVKAMFLRSVSHSDKWHHSEGYFANRTAYLHTFSRCGKFTRTETINF